MTRNMNELSKSITSGEPLLRINDGAIEVGMFFWTPQGYVWRASYVQPPARMFADIAVNESGYRSAFGISNELDEFLTASI